MLKRHEIEVLLKGGRAKIELGVSPSSIKRIAAEVRVCMSMMPSSGPSGRSAVRPEKLALAHPSLLPHDGHAYSMPAKAIGVPGTLCLYGDQVRVVAGRHKAVVWTIS